MPVNMYDLAARMPIINTYVPIDFGELYRIATTQKAAVDEATREVGETILRFGEFTSPSDIDVQNYYDLSIGQMSDLIDSAIADPDRMKDPAFRSELYSRINGLNYADLSRLREGADALRTRLENIARMIANGTYNEAWDMYPNLSLYDTLSSGILDELAPVAYMSANDLSDPYYKNLTPGHIGFTYQDGVKYGVTGNTEEDLWQIANARYSDMIRTPQGQMYYQQFLRESGNDPAEAERRFKSMIVASLMDRTLRPTLTVDPAWLASYRASRSGRTGSADGTSPWAQRLDLIQKSFMDNTDLSSLSPDARVEYRERMSSLGRSLASAQQEYISNPTDENLENLARATYAITTSQYQVISEANRSRALNKFNEITGSYERQAAPENPDKERRGIAGALNEISQSIGILENDPIITNLGATYNTEDRSWSFSDAVSFITPETMYDLTVQLSNTPTELSTEYGSYLPEWLRFVANGVAGVYGPAVGEGVGRITSSLAERTLSVGLREALESGQFTDVRFIPSAKIIQDGPQDYALNGKIYIPKDLVDDILNLGFWSNFFGVSLSERADRKKMLEEFYRAKEVKRTVNGVETEYYEFPNMYLQLPSTMETEWWGGMQTMWLNSGGIGGASQAKEAYGAFSDDTFGGY